MCPSNIGIAAYYHIGEIRAFRLGEIMAWRSLSPNRNLEGAADEARGILNFQCRRKREIERMSGVLAAGAKYLAVKLLGNAARETESAEAIALM